MALVLFYRVDLASYRFNSKYAQSSKLSLLARPRGYITSKVWLETIINKVYLLLREIILSAFETPNKPRKKQPKLFRLDGGRREFPYKFTFSFWIPEAPKKTNVKYIKIKHRFLVALKHHVHSVLGRDKTRKKNEIHYAMRGRFREKKIMNEPKRLWQCWMTTKGERRERERSRERCETT